LVVTHSARLSDLPAIEPGATGKEADVPLYEIVLLYPDRDETRVTDKAPIPGSTIQVAGRHWLVFEAAKDAPLRFLLRPTGRSASKASVA
jgi:hypothetical protein